MSTIECFVKGERLVFGIPLIDTIPFESHSVGLPLISLLPPQIAYAYARLFKHSKMKDVNLPIICSRWYRVEEFQLL